MTSEQRNNWLLKGEIPARTEESGTSPKTESSEQPSAPSAEGSESPAPASEPGNSQEQKKGKHNAESRIRELNAENKRIKAELDRLLASQPQPPATQPPPQQQPKAPQRPVRPKLEDFDNIDKYDAALDKYHEDLSDFKASQKIAELQASQARQANERRTQEINRQIETHWKGQIESARASHADFDDIAGTGPQGRSDGAKIPVNPVMDGFILSSNHGAELLYRLGSDLAEAERISKLAPADCLRALVRLEMTAEKPAEATPPPAPKKVTSAPPPPRDIQARNSAPADEIGKAVADDDFRAFYRLQNQKDLAARK
ncbi:MAG TPA: hypothetical protein VGR96_15910 [Acidobacteriaceae bacterium]|nr:hypothetical protein [Acidobacteriaceae bacterium]